MTRETTDQALARLNLPREPDDPALYALARSYCNSTMERWDEMPLHSPDGGNDQLYHLMLARLWREKLRAEGFDITLGR